MNEIIEHLPVRCAGIKSADNDPLMALYLQHQDGTVRRLPISESDAYVLAMALQERLGDGRIAPTVDQGRADDDRTPNSEVRSWK